MPVFRERSVGEDVEHFTVAGDAWNTLRDLSERTETAPETLINEAIHVYALQLLLIEHALDGKRNSDLPSARSRPPHERFRATGGGR